MVPHILARSLPFIHLCRTNYKTAQTNDGETLQFQSRGGISFPYRRSPMSGCGILMGPLRQTRREVDPTGIVLDGPEELLERPAFAGAIPVLPAFDPRRITRLYGQQHLFGNKGLFMK